MKIGFNTCSVLVIELVAKWRDERISSIFWLPGFQTIIKGKEDILCKSPILDAFKAFNTPFFLYKPNDYKHIEAKISLKTKHTVNIF